jgi:hypothetical protein
MTSHIFGKDITRKFYPLEDSEPINLYSQAPAIYLFSAQPSLTVARAGTGALQTVNHWIESLGIPYTRTYTLPAVNDPAPTSTTPPTSYFWEAINYYAKSGGQLQTKLRTIELEKPSATETIPGTTAQDLIDIYPAINNYVETDSELETFITVAQDEIKSRLKSEGIEWGTIENLKEFRYALAFLAIQYLSESQIVEASDKFAIRAEIYSKKYETALSRITVKHDTDNDGQPDTESEQAGALIGVR